MQNELFEFQKNALMGKIAEPLCAEYKQAWRLCGNDKEMLVRLALKQQSIPYMSHACYKKLGLTKEYILSEFGDYINGKRTFEDVEGVNGYTYQLYVGFDKDFVADTDVTSLMWCSGPRIEIRTSKCPILYISNTSEVYISCDGYNSPRVYLFDDSRVVIEDCDDTCDVSVYKYGKDAIVETGRFCLKEPKVFNKQLKL